MNDDVKNERRPIAFFDFDGTITDKDTFMPYIKYVVGPFKFYALLVPLMPILLAYLMGFLRNDAAKEIVLSVYLKGFSRDFLFEKGAGFSRSILPRLLKKQGMDLLLQHQSQGHECVIVSASMDAYLSAWVNDNRLDGLLCSKMQINESGDFTGRLDGENCYGDQKVKLIKEVIKDVDGRLSFAYGDTKADLAMLRLVKHGFIWAGNRFNKV